MDNTSWFPAKISSSSLKIYTIGNPTPVTYAFGAGGAPSTLNLGSATYLGNTTGNFRISLTNVFNDGTATQEYSAYISIQGATSTVDFFMRGPDDVSNTAPGPICTYNGVTGAQPRHQSTSFGSYTPFDAGTTPPPCVEGWLGAASAGIATPTSNVSSNISTGASYNITVQEYTSAMAFVKNVLDRTTSVPISGLSYVFDNKTIASSVDPNVGLGYFSRNHPTIKDNNIYKVTYSITTAACGTKSQYSYFKILNGSTDGKYLKGNPNAVQSVKRVTIFPNPAVDDLHINWYVESEKAGTAKVSLIDVMGKIVLQNTYTENDGTNDFTLNVSSLPAGIYHYILSTSTETKQGSVVKQ